MELVESKSMASALEQKLAFTQDHLFRSEGLVDQLSEAIEEKLAENSQLRTVLRETRTELESSQAMVTQLEEESAKLTVAYENVVDQLELEHQRLNQTVAISEELKLVNKEYLALRQEYQSIAEQLNATKTESAQCSRTFESMRLQYSGLDSDLVGIKNRLNKKSEELEECKSELREIRGEHSNLLRALNMEKNQTDEWKKQATLHEKKLEDADAKHSELEKIALQQNKDLDEMRSRNKNLLEELAAAKSEIENAQDKAIKIDETRRLREKELEDLKVTYSEMEAIALQQSKELAENKRQNSELIAELAATKQKIVKSHALDESFFVNTIKKWVESIKSSFHWLDFQLYQILRIVVDWFGKLQEKFGDAIDQAGHKWWKIYSSYHVHLERLYGLTRTVLFLMGNKTQLAHEVLLSLYNRALIYLSEFFKTNLKNQRSISSWAETILSSLENHGNSLVIFCEAIACLLLVDFVLSSLIRKPRRKQAINVPKSARQASLLRKAKNFPK